ncbi:hypothetical protein KR059_001906, partial [Drosophila kikkawai]
SNTDYIDDIEEYSSGSLRPVLFVFYTLETVLNMLCMGFHVTGFQAIQLDQFGWEEQAMASFYLVIFYVFMALTLFQSINICTGHTPTITLELIKTSAATVAFLAVSLGTMWDAERQFYMFGHDPEQEHSSTKYINYEPVHPFFVYMRSQSISALACSVLYLLHTCLMFDYKLTQKRANSDESYMPISLFVFGRWVHTKLETYEWFKEFSSNDYIRV